MQQNQHKQIISIFISYPSILLYQQLYQLIAIKHQLIYHHNQICCSQNNKKSIFKQNFDLYDSTLQKMFQFSSQTITLTKQNLNSQIENSTSQTLIPIKARCILIDCDQQEKTQQLITKNTQKVFTLIDQKNIIITQNPLPLTFNSIDKIEENQFLTLIKNRIRSQMQKCNSIDGFLIYTSSGDKVSASLSAFILQFLKTQNENLKIMSFVVHPDLSCKNEEEIREKSCNSVLFYNYLSQHADIVHCFDDEKLKILCERNLQIINPTDIDMNRLLSHQIMNATSQFYQLPNQTAKYRSSKDFNVSINDFVLNYSPYPTFKYLHSIFSPILPTTMATQPLNEPTEVQTHLLVGSITTGDLSMCNFDHTSYQNFGFYVCFRGKSQIRTIGNQFSMLKMSGLLKFSQWSPTGTKMTIIDRPTIRYKEDNLLYADNQVSIIANNAGIVESFRNFFNVFQQNAKNKKLSGIDQNLIQKSKQNLRQIFDVYEEGTMAYPQDQIQEQ